MSLRDGLEQELQLEIDAAGEESAERKVAWYCFFCGALIAFIACFLVIPTHLDSHRLSASTIMGFTDMGVAAAVMVILFGMRKTATVSFMSKLFFISTVVIYPTVWITQSTLAMSGRSWAPFMGLKISFFVLSMIVVGPLWVNAFMIVALTVEAIILWNWYDLGHRAWIVSMGEPSYTVAFSVTGCILLFFRGKYRETSRELAKSQMRALEAKRSIQNIMDNLDQGFVTFDSHGIVHPVVSKSAFTLFEADPRGKFILDLTKAEVDRGTLDKALPLLFQNKLPFEIVKAIAPLHFTNSSNQFIELDYRPILNTKDQLEKIILISTNKTKEKKLEAKAEEEKIFSKMIVRILKNRNLFVRFIRETRKQLEAALLDIKGADYKPNLTDFLRTLHTLKGEAGYYSISTLANASHHYEEELGKISKTGKGEELQAVLQECVENLLKQIEEFSIKYKYLIGSMDSGVEKGREIPVDSIKSFAIQLEKELGVSAPLAKEFYQDFMFEPIEESLVHYESTVLEVAETLKKKVKFEMISSSPKIRINPERYQKLFSSLIHAFQNAVDHGIESVRERMSAGKDAFGKIEVSFQIVSPQPNQAQNLMNGKQTNASRFRIKIKDNGRGIDSQRIGELAVSRGLIPKEKLQAMSSEEVIQLVFAAGFSSKDKVTLLSGRGVGLDAIQAEAEKLSGRAWVETQVGKQSELYIEIPYDDKTAVVAEINQTAA